MAPTTETNIASATASTYTLVAADQGTTIKVKVSFTDDASNVRDADQRGDGGRLGGGQHPCDGRADDHRHGAGRADADGHHRHHGCDGLTTSATRTSGSGWPPTTLRRTSPRRRRAPTRGGGRPGHDDQGEGELHRRRLQRRDADQRGDGGRLGGGQHLATGAPTITGTAQVGQTLTAGTTAIMDANGLTSVSYTYQWIRVATTT